MIVSPGANARRATSARPRPATCCTRALGLCHVTFNDSSDELLLLADVDDELELELELVVEVAIAKLAERCGWQENSSKQH